MLIADPSTFDLAATLAHFAEHGYARLGVWASPETLAGLRERLDDLMLGRLPHAPFFFQPDSDSGRYEDLAFGKGWIGPSLAYRKIERLERDERFAAWMRNALFERVARTLIDGPITLYRALMFGKNASGGTALPWHQDGGAFWGIDRDPFLQIWTALDDAPLQAGCVEVVPGTHRAGLTTPEGGVIPDRWLEGVEDKAVALPAVAGEVILIHNHLWHRSQRNHSGQPRRAFTVCLLDGRTRCRRKKNPREFVTVFC